ncbi:hypothetical protein ANN_13852 [Periplaneta americana]|uniref:Uncharacterized protein n=1 Tax=Periplaneta americana TaxID=6978 RepID=A0ABQ8SVP0_PERAM|nr:hypothetical protein ANN_13852 [Periplaneta americana]
MLAGNEFQSLGRTIVKEDEYEEVRWDDIVSIVSWRERVFRLWWEERNAYRVLVGRPEGKRPLGRPRRRWEDNIKMDLREVGYDDRDWINLAQDRDQWRAYVRVAMNLRLSRIDGALTSRGIGGYMVFWLRMQQIQAYELRTDAIDLRRLQNNIINRRRNGFQSELDAVAESIPIKYKAKPGSKRVFGMKMIYTVLLKPLNMALLYVKPSFHIPRKALESRVKTDNSTKGAMGPSGT